MARLSPSQELGSGIFSYNGYFILAPRNQEESWAILIESKRGPKIVGEGFGSLEEAQRTIDEWWSLKQ